MKTAREYVAETSSNEPHSKRARLSSESAEQRLFRHSAAIKRPGRPEPISLANYRFEGKVSPPLRSDDKEGHYVYELGENISSRYKILSKFGEGTFGRVLECWDRLERDYVAVKVVRNVDKYRHAAMIELEVLATLEQNDPTGRRHCVRLKEWFDYRGHVCMVFERLGPSLYDFLRRNDYAPFPMAAVQSIARQVLSAVAYMHELKLVHTDLKPENVLLVSGEYDKVPAPLAGGGGGGAAGGGGNNGGGGGGGNNNAAANGAAVAAATSTPPLRRVPRSTAVRVIDFGSATFEDGYHSSVVSTRHYRAPEVILGLGWSYPCDLWSVGCILVELATGDALFQTHENLEHLAMMERALGPCPAPMVARADRQAQKLFGAGGALAWPPAQQDTPAARKSLAAVDALRDLKGLLEERCDPPPPVAAAPAKAGGAAAEAGEAAARREHDLHVRAVALLADLAASCLRYDPEARVTAAAALQHPFFKLPLGQPPAQQQPAAGAAGGVAAAAGTSRAAAAAAAPALAAAAAAQAPAAPPAPPAPLLAKAAAAKAAPGQQGQADEAGAAVASSGRAGGAAAAAAGGGEGGAAPPAQQQQQQQQQPSRRPARVAATQQLVTAGSGGGAG